MSSSLAASSASCRTGRQ